MKNIFLKSFNLNLKRNKTIFIVFSILFFLVAIICVALCHGVYGWGYIGVHNIYDKDTFINGDNADWIQGSDMCIPLISSLKYLTFGLLSTIMIIIYTCNTSKTIISSEIECGAISFWLTKKISKNQIIFGKILSIYFSIIIFWLISFLPISLTLLTVKDKWNVSNIMIYMIQYLFFSLLISSIIIILNILLRKNNEIFIIVCSTIGLYLCVMAFTEKYFANNWIKYFDINNIFASCLNVSYKYTKIIYSLFFDGKPEFKNELFGLEEVDIVHTIIGILISSLLIYELSYLSSIIFKKIEFSI